MTALHVAVQNGRLDVARILVKELGCDVNDEERKGGNTCLHLFMGIHQGGSMSMLKYLLHNDADPNITNYSGWVLKIIVFFLIIDYCLFFVNCDYKKVLLYLSLKAVGVFVPTILFWVSF